jgi:hypothetical protein
VGWWWTDPVVAPVMIPIPLLFTEEFELVIMIEVVIEEMHGSN